MMSSTISWRTMTAMVPSAAPSASAPTSPMNTSAGYALNHRKPRPAPPIAPQITASSPAPGMLREAQVPREDRVADHVREDAERARHHHRRHDREAVESVGQVDRVARADDHEVGKHDEAPRAERIRHRLEERHDEVGAPGQSRREPALHPFVEEARELRVVLRGHREREVESGDEADRRTARRTWPSPTVPSDCDTRPCASRRPSRRCRSPASRAARPTRSGS